MNPDSVVYEARVVTFGVLDLYNTHLTRSSNENRFYKEELIVYNFVPQNYKPY